MRTDRIIDQLLDEDGAWKNANHVATTDIDPEAMKALGVGLGEEDAAVVAVVVLELVLVIALPLAGPFRVLGANPIGLWIDCGSESGRRFASPMVLLPWSSICALKLHVDPLSPER